MPNEMIRMQDLEVFNPSEPPPPPQPIYALSFIVGNEIVLYGANADDHPLPLGEMITKTFRGLKIWEAFGSTGNGRFNLNFGDAGGEFIGGSEIQVQFINGPTTTLTFADGLYSVVDFDVVNFLIANEGERVDANLIVGGIIDSIEFDNSFDESFA